VVSIASVKSQEPLAWPESLRPERRVFLAALLQNGPGCYARNVHEEFAVARLGDGVLPLVINHGGSSACYLTSPLCHYADYPYEIVRARSYFAGKMATLAVMRALRAFYRATRLNCVVYVNNWLIPTQPAAHLDGELATTLTERLIDLYPEHALLFKGVEPGGQPALSRALAGAGYEMIAHRQPCFWDPGDPGARKRSHLKRDLGLLRRTGCRVGWAGTPAIADSGRLRQLYCALYEEKYSRFNLQYTEAFFDLAQQSRLLEFFLIEKSGRIDGFSSLLRDGTQLISSLTGYDPTVPREEGLYRMGQVSLIQEAMNSGLLLNLSAGAEEFKMMRGARPRLEYEAVYTRHLSLTRRLPWRILSRLANSLFKKPVAQPDN
jgi:hypothetical protein